VRIRTAYDLGRYVRDRRRAAGMTQTDLASRAEVSRRWLSDLESGKQTAEVGLVLRVVAALGMYADLLPEPTPEVDLDAYLDSLGAPL
jgi:y4mF family transcriptional regulator